MHVIGKRATNIIVIYPRRPSQDFYESILVPDFIRQRRSDIRKQLKLEDKDYRATWTNFWGVSMHVRFERFCIKPDRANMYAKNQRVRCANFPSSTSLRNKSVRNRPALFFEY